jgi:integrase
MGLYKRPDSKNIYMDFMIQGKRINRTTGTATKKLARKVEKAAKEQTIEMMFAPQCAKSVSLQAYIEEVYSDKWAGQASGDQTYERLQLVVELIGDIDLSLIDRRMLKGLRQKLSKNRGVATVNRYMAHVKTLLNEAVKDTLIERVPFIDMLPEPKTRDIFYTLSDSDEALLLDFTGKGDGLVRVLGDIIVLGIETGMRLGEMLALRFSDNVQVGRSRIVLYADMTKSGQHRIIPMSPKVSALIDRRQHLCTGDLVFTGRDGKAIRKTTISHLWSKVRDASIGGNTTPHSLRHTFATRALSGGMNIKYVQALLGHASVKTTERYVHIIAEDLTTAFNDVFKE